MTCRRLCEWDPVNFPDPECNACPEYVEDSAVHRLLHCTAYESPRSQLAATLASLRLDLTLPTILNLHGVAADKRAQVVQAMCTFLVDTGLDHTFVRKPLESQPGDHTDTQDGS